MRKIYIVIVAITLSSCLEFYKKKDNKLLERLRGKWELVFISRYDAKYDSLNFLNDSIIVCKSGNEIDTLSYESGLRSITLIYPEGDTSYFYVTKLGDKHLTLREDVSHLFKSEVSIHYEREFGK